MSDMLFMHHDVHMISPVARAASPEDKIFIFVIANNAIKLMQIYISALLTTDSDPLHRKD